MWEQIKKSLLNESIVIFVSKDFMEAINLNTGNHSQIYAETPFTTNRLLIGNFDVATKITKQLIAKTIPRSWIPPTPICLIQPLSHTEGGLSQIETRAFQEMALAAGARDVYVHTSEWRISRDEAIQILKSNNK